MDETGFAPTTQRNHGWAVRGEKVYGLRSSQRRPRTGLIGGWLRNQLVAPMLFEGTCDTELFNTWLKESLLPQLPKGSVVVLDNATFHKSSLTLQLIEAAGCKLLFLPPYSPHLNPIEKLWANIKRLWQYHCHLSLSDLIKSFF